MTKFTLDGLPVISPATRKIIFEEARTDINATARYVRRFIEENSGLHDALLIQMKLLNSSYSQDLMRGAGEELAFSYEFLARELEHSFPERKLPEVDVSTGLEESPRMYKNPDYYKEIIARIERENPLYLKNLAAMVDAWAKVTNWPRDFQVNLIRQNWQMYELLRKQSAKEMAHNSPFN